MTLDVVNTNSHTEYAYASGIAACRGQSTRASMHAEAERAGTTLSEERAETTPLEPQEPPLSICLNTHGDACSLSCKRHSPPHAGQSLDECRDQSPYSYLS